MYSKEIFEMAMTSCGYTADKVMYVDGSQEVNKIIGRVNIPKKVVISGKSRIVLEEKRFRWDNIGRCFSLQSNVRQRRYDLPLMTILEFSKQKETEEQML